MPESPPKTTEQIQKQYRRNHNIREGEDKEEAELPTREGGCEGRHPPQDWRTGVRR